MKLPAANLDLVLQTPEELLAHIETLSPADRAEVSPAWLERVRATQPGDFWQLGFTMLERASGAVVGGCGFKGPPDAEGGVEIAYGVDTECRSRGYATEAALALTEFAFTQPHIRLVRAHTRPENNASVRVLTKCGFMKVGELIDPEDGLVWRWEFERNRR